MKPIGRVVPGIAIVAALACGSHAFAQGVTTGSLTGIVMDAQKALVPGATVTATHLPSGTTYEGVTQADGRFSLPGMRVGGPYRVSVALSGFQIETRENVTVSLGTATDLEFTLRVAGVTETVTVVGAADPVFSSSRTGAATAISQETLASFPTVSRRVQDFTRLTPQASGFSFVGQDSRFNNMTVDGSYFNNSFGLASTPGDRTNVAPISLDAIEQIQVSIAPFDVRQGNFVGAAINTVTRSGTNQLRGSFYHRFRDDGLVGTEAKGLPFNPGTFKFRNTGGYAGGPVVKNRLFLFGNFEDDKFTQPGTTFVANAGGQPVGGSVTRVLALDLDRLSSFLKANFDYTTGGYQGYDFKTPARRFLIKPDFNLSTNHKLTFRFQYLDSNTPVLVSNSSSLGAGNRRSSTFGLNFQNSNYTILENIRSGVGEWNAVIGNTMANSLLIGYDTRDESRGAIEKLFPFVDILEGGSVYTSFGSEPFTPNNELRYHTFQLQNNFTKFGAKHSLTFGGTIQRYESENVFFPGSQSVYVYNSLADFYTDANGYLANPNRTVAPITLNRFQVRWMNIPGLSKPIQPLEVWYGGAYTQDEWRPRSNLTVTAGFRFDVPVFGDTGFANPDADARTFRDEQGNPVQYSTAKLPDANILWSPRVGFNWDVGGDRRTQIRGGTGVFTGPPPYVWISNQIGNTGVLTGFESLTNTTARPFHPDPNHYKPASVTGAPATSYELALTDRDFKFPQTWRSNIAVDHRLPFDLTATAEFIYNRDVNGIYYINANLPAAQAAFVGADARPRWTSNRLPANTNVSNAIVLKNQSVGRSWNIAGSVKRALKAGFEAQGAYSYGESKNTVDPGSIAFGSWAGNAHAGDPNNPGLGFSGASPGHRVFIAASYTREYFNFGQTTVAVFWEGRTIGNTSYTFAGDMNGDGAANSDLIYIHRDISEMNFAQFTSGGRTFTAAEQAAAWNAYIEQDSYLKNRRGRYAERGAVFLPMVRRMDLSITQDIFARVRGKRNAFQVRLDITNFGNLLNSDWGVGQRLITNQPLTNPGVDAQGRSTYRLRVVGGELLSRSLQPTTFFSDVYTIQISLRFTFN